MSTSQLVLNWVRKGYDRHLQKPQQSRRLRVREAQEPSLPPWGPSPGRTQSSTCSRDRRTRETVETSTHGFCLQAVGEANVLAWEGRLTGVLPTGHLGWGLRDGDEDKDVSSGAGARDVGVQGRLPGCYCPWAFAQPLPSVCHALPMPSSGKLLFVLQNSPSREPALTSRLFQGPPPGSVSPWSFPPSKL